MGLTEIGLWFRAKVSKTRDGKDVEVLIEDGALKEFSIGFITKGYEWNEDDEVRTLTEVELWEISLVTRAANEQARLVTTEVKSEADTILTDGMNAPKKFKPRRLS